LQQVSECKRRNSLLSFLEFADALATAGAAFVRDAAGRPEVRELRRMLLRNLLPPTTRMDELLADDRQVAEWLVRESRPRQACPSC
jgi:hypothetical protein